MSEMLDRKLVVLKNKLPGNICFISRYDEKGVLKSQGAMKGWHDWEKDPKWELLELENVPFIPELEGRRSRYTRYSGDTVRIRHPVYDVIFEISMEHFFEIIFKEGLDEGFQFRSSYYIKGTSGSITLISSDAKDLSFFEGTTVKKKQISSHDATDNHLRRPVWFPIQKTYGYFFTRVITTELISRSGWGIHLIEGYISQYSNRNIENRDLFYLPEKKAYITSSKDFYEVVSGLPIYKDVDPGKTVEAKKPYWINDSAELTTENILNMTYFPNWSRTVTTSDGSKFVLFNNEALSLIDTKSGIYYCEMKLLSHGNLRIEDKIYVPDVQAAKDEEQRSNDRGYRHKLINEGQKAADDWLASITLKLTYLSSDPYVFKGDPIDLSSPQVSKKKNATAANYHVKFPAPYRAATYYNTTGKPLDPAHKAMFEAVERGKVSASVKQYEAWRLELQAMTPDGFIISPTYNG